MANILFSILSTFNFTLSINEFNNSDEPGIIDNYREKEERIKFEKWLKNTDWRQPEHNN